MPAPVAPANVTQVMSPSQIQQQATKTVAAQYAPVISSIQQQEQQATGLADKRDADNQAYQKWLGAQTTALENTRTAQDGQLSDLLGKINTAQSNLYGGNMSAALTNEANNRMGNVSNNADSNLIGTAGSSYTQAMEQSGRGLVDAATSTAARNALTQNDMLRGSEANDAAVINNNTKVNDADLQNTLNRLSNTLATTQQKETADAATQYNDLYKQNISLAENNRDYNATAYLDGIKGQTDLANIANNAAKTKASLANTASSIAARNSNAANNTRRAGAYVNNLNIKTGQLKTGGGVTKSERLGEQKLINKAASDASGLSSGYISVPGYPGMQSVRAVAAADPKYVHDLWKNGGTYYVQVMVNKTQTDPSTGNKKVVQVPTYKAVTVKAHSNSDYTSWAGFQTSNLGQGLTQYNVNDLLRSGFGTLGYGLAPGTKNAISKVAKTKAGAPKATGKKK